MAKDKEGTLYFQVIHRRSTRTVYTDYHIRPDEWNEKTSSVRVTGTPERVGIPAPAAVPDLVQLHPWHGGEKAPCRQVRNRQDLP